MEDQRKQLFRIGEVSRLFHISIGTLRHYDKMGLLKPEYTDQETGYRYYGIRQFECLNTIRYLRLLDMPLEEIGAFLDSRDTDKMWEMLRRQKQEVERRQQELKRIERRIDKRLEQLEDALHSEFEKIRMIRTCPRRLALLRTEVKPETYLDLEYSIRRLEDEEPVAFLGKVGVGISKERLEAGLFGSYDMVFVVLEEDERFCGGTLELSQELCASLRFQGTHRQAEKYYGMLMGYVREQGYKAAGFSKEITMIDQGLTHDCSKFVTEIQIPVVKA